MACRTISSMVCSDFVGNRFSLCISNEGTVFSFGSHTCNGHGHDEERIFTPKVIPSLKNIKSICCGFNHTICLDYDGLVFTFGGNDAGQLGLGMEHAIVKEPQNVILPLIHQISCGNSFSMCLSESGELYSFGYNLFGQLGIGNFEEHFGTPQLISSLKDIEFVECGGNYVICKTLDNQIYCWGDNEYGQLGLGKIKENVSIPTKCEDCPENLVDIKCGQNHTLVLTLNREVYSCGKNLYNQLGLSKGNVAILRQIEEFHDIVRIECGSNHSICITSSGNFYAFGENVHGQLGLGDYSRKTRTPILNTFKGDVIDVSSGGDHTFIKTSNNEIYAFGFNSKSQLGMNLENSKSSTATPTRAFKDSEHVWCSTIHKSRAKSARK